MMDETRRETRTRTRARFGWSPRHVGVDPVSLSLYDCARPRAVWAVWDDGRISISIEQKSEVARREMWGALARERNKELWKEIYPARYVLCVVCKV